MGDEALCTCGHTRGMHDICHFDHNECLCGCREFIPAAHLAAPDELTALRQSQVRHAKQMQAKDEELDALRERIRALADRDKDGPLPRRIITPDDLREAAADAIFNETAVRAAMNQPDLTIDDLARIALAAAEGPWREHLATQLIEHRDYAASFDPKPEFLVGLETAAGIVRRSDPVDEFQDSED